MLWFKLNLILSIQETIKSFWNSQISRPISFLLNSNKNPSNNLSRFSISHNATISLAQECHEPNWTEHFSNTLKRWTISASQTQSQLLSFPAWCNHTVRLPLIRMLPKSRFQDIQKKITKTRQRKRKTPSQTTLMPTVPPGNHFLCEICKIFIESTFS